MERLSLKLGEILIKRGLIDESQLKEALTINARDNLKLGEVLIEKNWVNEHALSEVLAEVFQIPFMSLKDYQIQTHMLDVIPFELIENYKILPIELKENQLIIATNDPLNTTVLQDIQYTSNYSIKPVMASMSDLEYQIQEYFDALHNVKTVTKVDNQKKKAPETTVVSLVESIFRKAIKERASDIHFEPMKDRMRVRFRIDGVLFDREPILKELERNVISRIKIIADLDVAENRRPQDGRISFLNRAEKYDLRVSTLPNILGEHLVLRILSTTFTQHSFEDLGMQTKDVNLMKSFIEKPYGLILVTGPTGAGKTTTLYTLLNSVNEASKSIVSVEDPVEYELEGVNQTAINNHIGYTFGKSIRHILRHDPDIIMVGEIRDAETAEMAIQSALTGHLVLSTIHTNRAAGAITRLVEMNIEPFLIASSLIGVVAQRLVRHVCPLCHTEVEPEKEIIERVSQYIPVPTGAKFAEPQGCEHCFDTGYVGRKGIYEILQVNDAIKKQIVHSADESEIHAKACENGMNTLQQAAMHKVISKTTDFKEVLKSVFLT